MENLTNLSELFRIHEERKIPPTGIRIILLIRKADLSTTSTGKDYYTFTLSDTKRDIICRDFNGNIRYEEGHNYVEFLGTVDEFNSEYNLKIRKGILSEKVDLNGFFKEEVEMVDNLKKEIYNYISKIKDEFLKNMVTKILQRNPYFWDCPGAVFHHHNKKHGLAEHTLEVLSLAYNMGLVKSISANIDLIIAGSILHDIGKTTVYGLKDQFGLELEYDVVGGLSEHLVAGVSIVESWVKDYGVVNDRERMMVKLINHIILSHHGELEYGSPVTPKFIEAIIVNKADNVSAIIEPILSERKVTSKGTVKLFGKNEFFTAGYIGKIMNPGNVDRIEDKGEDCLQPNDQGRDSIKIGWNI